MKPPPSLPQAVARIPGRRPFCIRGGVGPARRVCAEMLARLSSGGPRTLRGRFGDVALSVQVSLRKEDAPVWGPVGRFGRTLRGRSLICPGLARDEVLRPARRARTLWGCSAKCPAVGRMTLRPQSVSQSVRLKRPDGLEGASKRPLWGILAHSATSPKCRSRCWLRRPAARGGSRPPPVEEGIMSRFFCGRQPCRLIAPLSSEGMPLLTVELANNRAFCPAVAKTCDCLQVAGAAKLFLALFPC